MSWSRILGSATLLAFVLSLGFVGVESAIPNPTNKKYYACFSKKSGAVRLINYPKVSKCPRGWKLRNWNAKGNPGAAGPVGPAGPAGTAGITKMVFTNTVSPANSLPGNTSQEFDFACPPGQKVTGGGFYTPSPADVQIFGSLPVSPTAWRVWARNTNAASKLVYVWAQCLATDPGTVIAKFSPSAKKAKNASKAGAGAAKSKKNKKRGG